MGFPAICCCIDGAHSSRCVRGRQLVEPGRARYFLPDPRRRTTMMSTVVGGAMLPHAPQFFTMPDTEDKAVVAHVREVAADIGEKLRALDPDLWIIFSNDHAEQFFHNACPAFTVHVGGEAT